MFSLKCYYVYNIKNEHTHTHREREREEKDNICQSLSLSM